MHRHWTRDGDRDRGRTELTGTGGGDQAPQILIESELDNPLVERAKTITGTDRTNLREPQ